MVRSKRPNIWAIRAAMASFRPAGRVEPNEQVSPDRVFTPESHRSVLDLGRQLVVGNRGMGKSLWTHALTDPDVRARAAKVYFQPALVQADVIIGFNGSDKTSEVAPTREALARALTAGFTADDIWRAVIYRAVKQVCGTPEERAIEATLKKLASNLGLYEEGLSEADDRLVKQNKSLLIIFDALDRLADDWKEIRSLTSSLMRRALGLASFKSFRAKIFIRPDQYADASIFAFPDGSKLKNDHVNLTWQPYELFGLLLFELLKNDDSKQALQIMASGVDASGALDFSGKRDRGSQEEQKLLIDALAGQYMGSDARRGRVYTWVPLHLSDAKDACSPRTFLTAWQKAAEHEPAPKDKVVDHLGLIEGVRKASSTRLEELREDYRWIDGALGALRGQFVPIERDDLEDIWSMSDVVKKILKEARKGKWLAPVELETEADGTSALVEALKNIAVMEERANGKINVPDIFRVEAQIKRKGGVAVPRRS